MWKGSVNVMEVIKQFGWVYYVGDDIELDDEKVGKWMYFFNNRKFVEKICAEVIEQGIVVESKHSDAEEGVACFYLNCDDLEGHKKVISYFLENRLIRRTKDGRLYNISFKRDEQTSLFEYGNGFKSEIKLAKFIDLATGKWRITEDEFEAIMPPEVQRHMRWLKNLRQAEALKTTAPEQISYSQCLAAVRVSANYLQYVPIAYRTAELCQIAMRQRPVVEFIPPHILNLEFVDEAIRANNFIIGGIPAELIKKETAVEVVINDSNLIKRIPETIKDIDFYERLIKENGMCLRLVPHNLITPAICEIAVNSRANAIKYVPPEMIDDNLCRLAVYTDWKALRLIPQSLLSEALFELALNTHPKSRKSILKEREKVVK